MENLTGTSLVGMSKTRERVENDYYATPYEATELLLNNFEFKNKEEFLEPCISGGHIAKIIKHRYPTSEIVGLDIVDRGYKDTIVHDFFNL